MNAFWRDLWARRFKPRAAHLRRGAQGERWAKKYLQQQGLRVVAQNFRRVYGEIDLIAWEGETLVFVEVRRRKKGGLVSAAESITPAKMKKLRLTAQTYLQKECARAVPPCRFDALCIDDDDETCRIQWLKNI